MTKSDFESEKRFCLIMHMATLLRETGVITETEIRAVRDSAIMKNRPAAAHLIPFNISN